MTKLESAQIESDDSEMDEIWCDDVLRRQDDAVFLRDFLVGRAQERRSNEEASRYVLNLNAAWGEF